MAYKVVRSAACDRDLGLIFDHLIQSYISLGDAPADAFDRAVKRLRSIEDAMENLATAPHQGTLWPEIAPGLRHVTKDRAIFYFDVDDAKTLIRVLAVFFGGQEHQRHMLKRLMGDDG